MQLLNIWFPCSFLIPFKARWGDLSDTMSKTVRAPIHSTEHSSFQQESGHSTEVTPHWMRRWLCSQQFSPVADWMSSVDLFLEDEGQQYGNMEEAASVARTPATCLEVWSGDHRQTPGGLKKSKEAKSFRKKLTKRPLALRCQTQSTQAHELGGIAMRYLDCPEGSFPWKIRQLLEDNSSAIDPAVAQSWHDLIGNSPPCLSREIQRCFRHPVDGLTWRKRRTS